MSRTGRVAAGFQSTKDRCERSSSAFFRAGRVQDPHRRQGARLVEVEGPRQDHRRTPRAELVMSTPFMFWLPDHGEAPQPRPEDLGDSRLEQRSNLNLRLRIPGSNRSAPERNGTFRPLGRLDIRESWIISIPWSSGGSRPPSVRGDRQTDLGMISCPCGRGHRGPAADGRAGCRARDERGARRARCEA